MPSGDLKKKDCQETLIFSLILLKYLFSLSFPSPHTLIYERPKRTLYSKKYGVDLIRYTHAANTVVYSSNKIDGMLMHKHNFFL